MLLICVLCHCLCLLTLTLLRNVRFGWCLYESCFLKIFSFPPEITAKVTCTWPRELSHPWVITTFRKVTFINEIYIADTQWWWKSAASDILGVTLRTINTYANLYNPANCLFFHLPRLSFSPFHYCQSLSFFAHSRLSVSWNMFPVLFGLFWGLEQHPYHSQTQQGCEKEVLSGELFLSILLACVFFFLPPSLLFLKQMV